MPPSLTFLPPSLLSPRTMRTIVAWTDKVPERDGVKSCVYDIVFKPDGSQLVAAVGSRVLVYDAVNGELLHSLKVNPFSSLPSSSSSSLAVRTASHT